VNDRLHVAMEWGFAPPGLAAGVPERPSNWVGRGMARTPLASSEEGAIVMVQVRTKSTQRRSGP